MVVEEEIEDTEASEERAEPEGDSSASLDSMSTTPASLLIFPTTEVSVEVTSTISSRAALNLKLGIAVKEEDAAVVAEVEVKGASVVGGVFPVRLRNW
jgi:hypothetical protein